MNTLVKARQDALQSLVSEYQGLSEKSEHTEGDNKRLAELSGEMKAARTALDEAKALDSIATENNAHLNGNGRMSSIGAVNPQLASNEQIRQTLAQAGMADQAIDAMLGQINGTVNLGKRTEFAEFAGTELYGYGRTKSGDAGELVPKSSEGWGMTEKQFRAISEPKYAQAFDRMLRGKADSHDYQSTLTEGLDSGGGFLAPPEFMAEVIMRKPHPTSILSYVRTLPCSRDRVIFPKVNYTTDDIYSSGVRIQWIGESGPTNAVTDPAFGDVEIPVWTGQFPLEVSRNLLEDAAVPVQALIQDLAAQAYNLGMDNVVVNGTGVGQPSGLLQNPGASNEPPTANVGNPVTADGLLGLVYGLPPQYQDGAVAFMNFVDAFATFTKIKDSANHYVFGLTDIWGGGLATARVPRLFGKEVIFSAFMPNGASAAKVLGYGNLRETYVLAQRVGLTVMPYGDQDKSMLQANKVGWMFRFRAGGDVVQGRATRIGVQS